ncbi:DUF927 domain-containing protein [Thiothrix winogradskyi]|uniref:DUF927 domain-containing protein n=1 Tax=Thiothrix winogradskyi TaxID=96472 RepID=A0ABY3SXZ6_9GAMM|nr:DUF927 domain-containing protein [Thiothrix winogradskyi]UJS24034.1 DUF927 domain-containing protein [Thiothrix winogradskyi]
MSATAQTTPDTDVFSAFEAKAQAATMENYTALLEELAAYTINDVFDPVQRTLLIVALGNNKTLGVGKRAAGNALAAVEKAAKRATQGEPDGIKGGRGVYSLRDNGVWYSKPTTNGYSEPVCISPHLQVIAETYDTTDGNNGRFIEFKDTRGRLKTWAMPAIFAAGDGVEITKYLRGNGLNFVYGNDKEIIDYLLSSPVTDLMTCSDRTGWVDDVFITPKTNYGENAERYTYQPTSVIDNKIGQAGTLADWQANVARYAQGNPLTMLALSSAFTGALLKQSGMMGFGLHLWSSSSDGKSTTMKTACSVWGSEFWQQWLSTSVGIEGSAYAHNDLFLALDEIGEATAQTVSATAYALANGEGKRRGGRDGNAKITKKWRVVFLSTGEKSLDALMKEAGMVTRAGQEVRMINVRSDAWKHGAFNDLHGMGNGSVFAEMLEANTKKYYGTAGDAWLYAITQPGGIPDDISQAIDAIRETMLPEDASGQVRRVARQFALIAYAGELATKHGITGWKAGEATAAAKECFDSWVDDFGGADGKREHRQVIEAVESFLFSQISRFQGTNLSEGSVYNIKDRVGFVRNRPEEDGAFLVPTAQLVKLAEGYSKEQIIAALRTVDMINAPDKDGKNAINISLRAEDKDLNEPEFGISHPSI